MKSGVLVGKGSMPGAFRRALRRVQGPSARSASSRPADCGSTKAPGAPTRVKEQDPFWATAGDGGGPCRHSRHELRLAERGVRVGVVDWLARLRIAWKRVRPDRKTDFVIGDFEYAIYHQGHEDLLALLADRVAREGKDYQPQPMRVIRVPKGGHTTRPGAVPAIDDRIYYQSLVDEIADTVEDQLVPPSDGVLHSYRYAGDREAADMFSREDASFTTFNRRTREIAKSHKFLIVTDVASFYERIYHHELENTLRGLGASVEDVERVMALLRKWQKGISYGIPQGIWPSDYLGNLYLDPVDKFMSRAGYAYCRYVDDIRIGARSRVDADRTLVLLEERLASIGLTLSSAKTHIVPSADVDDVLFPYKPRFNAIFEELRAIFDDILVDLFPNSADDPYWEPSDEEIAATNVQIESQSIRQLLEEQLALDEPDPSVLRYCLRKARSFSDAAPLDEVLKNLNKLVLVTQQVVPYLLRMAKVSHTKKIRRRVAAFVVKDEAIYDWQLMWYLECLRRIGDLDPETVAAVRGLLLSHPSRLHDGVAVQAYLLVGRHGDDTDRWWMTEQYDREAPWVQRAILFAIRDLPATKRNHFYSYCKGKDALTDKTIDYCLQVKRVARGV